MYIVFVLNIIVASFYFRQHRKLFGNDALLLINIDMTNAMSKSYFTHVAYRENRSIVHDISHIAVDDYLDEVDIYCAIIDEDDRELDNEGSDLGEINFFF